MSFRIATAFVNVKADDNGLREDMAAKVRAAADSVHGTVRIDADSDGLAEKVRAAAEAADAETHVRVDVDETGLSSLDGDTRRLRDGFDDLQSSSRRTGSALDDVGNRSSSAGSKASAAGGGFRLASVGIGAAGVSAIALIPALAAIPGVAAAAAAGIATLASAFFGVGKALHDYGAAQDAVGGGGGGGGGGNTAATAYSNAVAVRGAEQAIADAREQSARSAQQSAEQIQNAQLGVVDAERNAATAAQSAADQITAAQQRVTQAAYAGQQAEQAYTNAVYNEQQAQRSLADARSAAADQLIDSQLAASGAHLAVEQAATNAKTAQDALAAAQGNAAVTEDQKAALDLAARVATQQLAEAKQHDKEATEKATAATKVGIDQAPSVLSAQHAVETAAQSTASAQHGVAAAAQQQADAQAALAKANRAAAEQQISSAEQVAKAQQNLADTEQQAQQQREDSAKQLQRAQQALTDTIKEQGLASEAAGASGAAAANKFQQDYAALTPAAKAFVDQVLSMRGQLHQLAADAQTATLPGFTQMLKDSQHLFPIVEEGIKGTGKALSDMAIGFGRLFANPAFLASAQQFEQLIVGGFGQFTSALPPLLNAIVVDGAKAAPLVNAIATGVHDLVGSGLPAFLDGLTTGASGSATAVGALFGGVNSLLGPVGTLAGSLANAVGPALGEVVPEVAHFADEIVQSLLPLMPQLSTDLKDLADVFGAVLQIVEPIIPLITDGLSSGLQILDPLLRDTAGFLRDNEQWLIPVAEGILAVVAATKAWGLASSGAQALLDKTAGGLSGLGSAGKAAGKEVEGAASKFGSFAGKLGNALPVVGGIAVGVVALGGYLQHLTEGEREAATSTDKFSLALLNAQNSASTAALDPFSRSMQGLGASADKAIDPLAQTGLGLAEVSQKLGFASDDLHNYDQSLGDLAANGNGKRAADVVAQIASATDGHGNALVDVQKAFPAYFAALDSQKVKQQGAAGATDAGTTALRGLGTQLDATKDKYQTMSDTMGRQEALDRFHSQLLDLSQAAKDNGTSLEGNSAQVWANKQQFSGLADQIQAYGKQLHDAGFTDDDVAKKMQGMVGELEDQGEKFGFSKTKVDAYIRSLGLIPSSVSTTVNTQFAIKLDQAALQRAADQIDHAVGHHIIPGQAAGGWVNGPGTGTSDSVLRRLSNGEYVVPADAAAQFGPAGMEQIRHGQVPTVGGTTPQASAPTINIAYYGTQHPTPEQQQILMRDLALAVRG